MDDSTLGTDVAFWRRQITMLEGRIKDDTPDEVVIQIIRCIMDIERLVFDR